MNGTCRFYSPQSRCPMEMGVDNGMEWARFVATCLVSYGAMTGTRWIATRNLPEWSERGRFALSAALGILLGVLLTIGLHPPLVLLIPLLFAAIGLYVGLLLIGTGWRHHVATRLVFWFAAFNAIGVSRLLT
jgi:hypothetical protein